MDNKVDYLPLGSVVVVQGGIKKYMIISRGLHVKINGKDKFFDYGACMYPEGIIGDKVMYFQHSNINKVIFEGYDDDDNKLMIENIHETFVKLDLHHEDVKQLKNDMEN